jgi:hypothetical protein
VIWADGSPKPAATYGVNSIPANYLIDGNGVIVARGLRGAKPGILHSNLIWLKVEAAPVSDKANENKIKLSGNKLPPIQTKTKELPFGGFFVFSSFLLPNLSTIAQWQYFLCRAKKYMKLRNPFSNRKVMSQESDKQSEFQDNPIAEEIQRSSEAEASEQKPLEEDPIGKLEKEISELKDNHLRLYAEFENYKRRNIKERAELIKSGRIRYHFLLLPTLDDFERALKAMGENADPSTREGHRP